MNREEALNLLNQAPKRPGIKSALNNLFTADYFLNLMITIIEAHEPGWKLTWLMEKRVYQAIRNQRRPRYK